LIFAFFFAREAESHQLIGFFRPPINSIAWVSIGVWNCQESATSPAWYVSYCSYFFAAAFCFAHLLRCASAIFFLAEGERVLLFVVGAADEDAGGRPLRLVGEDPASALRVCCRRAARSATGSGRRFSSLGDPQCTCGDQPLFASMIAAQTKQGR
jgi:hypothetical protein